jgi:hypothetical protein
MTWLTIANQDGSSETSSSKEKRDTLTTLRGEGR